MAHYWLALHTFLYHCCSVLYVCGINKWGYISVLYWDTLAIFKLNSIMFKHLYIHAFKGAIRTLIHILHFFSGACIWLCSYQFISFDVIFFSWMSCIMIFYQFISFNGIFFHKCRALCFFGYQFFSFHVIYLHKCHALWLFNALK